MLRNCVYNLQAQGFGEQGERVEAEDVFAKCEGDIDRVQCCPRFDHHHSNVRVCLPWLPKLCFSVKPADCFIHAFFQDCFVFLFLFISFDVD